MARISKQQHEGWKENLVGPGHCHLPFGHGPSYLRSARGCQEHEDGETRKAPFISAFETISPKFFAAGTSWLGSPKQLWERAEIKEVVGAWWTFPSFSSQHCLGTVLAMEAVSSGMNDLSSSDKQHHGSFNNAINNCTWADGSFQPAMLCAEEAPWSRIVCVWITHAVNNCGSALFCTQKGWKLCSLQAPAIGLVIGEAY